MNKYDHIQIKRESFEYKYRFYPSPNSVENAKDPCNHSIKLNKELSKSLEIIKSKRAICGIESNDRIVLQINSKESKPNVIENMLGRFNLDIMQETSTDDKDRKNYVVQFNDESSIELFNDERKSWESGNETTKILTKSQRCELFNSIEDIRDVLPEDRKGRRLDQFMKKSEYDDIDFFIVNIDIWYNGDSSQKLSIYNDINKALGTGGSKLLEDLLPLTSLLLGRVRVNIFTVKVLLDLDMVAYVELPISEIKTELSPTIPNPNFSPIIQNDLNSSSPLAAVLDSGIFSANPLLEGVVCAEKDFDNTENSTNDFNGHGTGVAGIVAYGDFYNKSNVFKPQVRICNGKIMHNDNGSTSFCEDKRPEQLVKEAIEYFNSEYGCRIFNLSIGDCDMIYTGGRQFAWAKLLDEMSKKLDIVIIVSAGNVTNPNINNFKTRNELSIKCRDNLFAPEHRLIDPATSALSVTVGAIARTSEPEVLENRLGRLSVGEKDYMSVFTRVGKGVNKSIKPELVDYGGNFAISTMGTDEKIWIRNDRNLFELSLNNKKDCVFKGGCGTSFSAPHVTHIAARIEKMLEQQLKEKPSSNLIKAMLVNSARYSENMKNWASESNDEFDSSVKNKIQERRLRLIGFGKIDDSSLFSTDNKVTLFAEDKLELRNYHIYKIQIPEEFLKGKSKKRISISLSYNPNTNMNRKEYLANNLWFEVYRKIDENELIKYKSNKNKKNNIKEYLDDLPNINKANFSPGYTELQRSTLQQRVWEKNKGGGSDLLWDENEPVINILVTGKERIKHKNYDTKQDYALVITFEYDSEESIELYDKLKESVNIKERTRARVNDRTKIKI